MSDLKTIDFTFDLPEPSSKPTPQKTNDVADELSNLFNDFGFSEPINDSSSISESTPTQKITTPIQQAIKPPLTLRISDKKTLHSMWMTIFKNGGLFIPKDQLGNKEFALGESVSFKISLPDDPANLLLINTKMAWETPKYTENKLIAGTGFAFDKSDISFSIKQRAERLIADVPANISSYSV